MAKNVTVSTENEGIVMEISTNDLVEEVVDGLVQEAIKHFNKIKNKVRDVEGDARYFYNEDELNRFLKGITYPDKIWVSTINDDNGKFFAYRVGRVITNKKGTRKI